MITEHEIINKVHEVDKQNGKHGIQIKNLEEWVADIHKTLKSVDTKVTLGAGALIGIQIAIQFVFKKWGN